MAIWPAKTGNNYFSGTMTDGVETMSDGVEIPTAN